MPTYQYYNKKTKEHFTENLPLHKRKFPCRDPFVELSITDTDPGLKGDTSGGGGKPATLETGAVVRVPLFVQIGEMIKVDTRTGEYVSRVKE
jgi:hypothetical protein